MVLTAFQFNVALILAVVILFIFLFFKKFIDEIAVSLISYFVGVFSPEYIYTSIITLRPPPAFYIPVWHTKICVPQ